jgi:hypothetical protein
MRFAVALDDSDVLSFVGCAALSSAPPSRGHVSVGSRVQRHTAGIRRAPRAEAYRETS